MTGDAAGTASTAPASMPREREKLRTIATIESRI
jgi:hypothetical protein